MTSMFYLGKRNPKVLAALGFLLSLALSGCSSPPLPPEAAQAERMSHELWKAQAALYAPEECRSFEMTLNKIRDDLIKEEGRFVWLRDYEPLAGRLRAALKEGEEILKSIQERKEAKKAEVSRQLSELEGKAREIDRVTLSINEGRLARSSLMRAALLLKEAGLLLEREDFQGAASRLTAASGYIEDSEHVLSSIFNRFSDNAVLEKWRKWFEQVTAESREKGIPAIVVSKIERRLTVYVNGRGVKVYEIGLGRNGLSDKAFAGDGATPEGSYRVVKKNPRSRYHKALLLNYPNEEDRREFRRLKEKGLIPERAGIGGLIEIHGGGKAGMTYGCVSLENRDMDEVFESIPLGTPVAIVGRMPLKRDRPDRPKESGKQ